MVRKHRLFLGATFFLIIYASGNVLIAISIQHLIDAATASDAMLFVRWLLIGVAMLSIEYVSGLISQRLTLQYVALRLTDAKDTLFANTLRGFGAYAKKNMAMYSSNPELLATNYFSNQLLMIYTVAEFVFSIAGMLYLNWILLIVTFATSLLPIAIPLLFQKKLTESVTAFSEKGGEYLRFVEDAHAGLYEIKSFKAQSFFEKLHHAINQDTEQKRFTQKMRAFAVNSTANFIGTLSFLATIGAGGFLLMDGRITVGVMLAAVQMLNSMVSPIVAFAQRIGEMRSTKPLAQSYEAPPAESVPDAIPSPFSTALSVENLSFGYMPDAQVLSDVTLTFDKGKKYAIVGDSGTGKSTLAKLLAGVLTDYEGCILLDGTDIRTFSRTAYCEIVKYIDQDPHLFELSLEDNITFGQPNDQIAGHLAQFGIAELTERSGMTVLSGDNAISGGQKQRLVLTRALLAHPGVLILDEPTANVNHEMALEMIRYVTSLENMTVIVITHAREASMLDCFDTIYTLRKTEDIR